MNVKELMIGAWVQYDRSYPPMGIMKPMQVTLQDLIDISQRDECKPIPLTPEILELNGFEKKHPDNPKLTYWIIRRGGGEINAKMHRGRLFVRVTGIPAAGDFFTPGCQGYVDFVHQLQHALKWCKMADLADNFKVE